MSHEIFLRLLWRKEKSSGVSPFCVETSVALLSRGLQRREDALPLCRFVSVYHVSLQSCIDLIMHLPNNVYAIMRICIMRPSNHLCTQFCVYPIICQSNHVSIPSCAYPTPCLSNPASIQSCIYPILCLSNLVFIQSCVVSVPHMARGGTTQHKPYR